MPTEETTARLLAEWLAAPAGTPPPEGLDTEVVAAVYALRPDRAPAARVSMDDIFGAIQAGPFAQAASTAPQTTAPEAEFPADAGSSGRTQRNTARRTEGSTRGESGVVERKAPRRPSRWWMAPAVGLSLAAAAALMLVVPVMGRYLSPSESKMTEEAVRSVQSATAPASDEAAGMDGGGNEPTVAATPVAPAAPALATPPVPAPDAAPPAAEVATRATATGAPAEGTENGWIPEIGEKPQAVATHADTPNDRVSAQSATGTNAAGGAGGSAGKGQILDASKDDLDTLGYIERRKEEATPTTTAVPAPAVTKTPAPKTIAPPPPAPTPAPAAAPSSGIAEMESNREWSSEKKASVDEEQDDADKSSEAAVAKSSKSKAAPSPAKPAANAGKPAPSRAGGPGAAAPAQANEPAAATRGADYGDASTEVNPRDAAVPHDYAASWYTSRGDIAPAFAAADALRAAGKTEDAIKAWTALIANSDPNVGQDAAFRAASLLRSNASRGLGLVAQGLARSSANTVFRSNLLLLKGDLLMGQGNAAGAAAAWAEAAKLNAAR